MACKLSFTAGGRREKEVKWRVETEGQKQQKVPTDTCEEVKAQRDVRLRVG